MYIALILGLQAALGQFEPGMTTFRGEIAPSWGLIGRDLMVELRDQATHTLVERSMVMVDGSFEFHQIRPASYELRVVRAGGEPLHSEYVNIHEGSVGVQMTIRLPDSQNSQTPGGAVALSTLSRRVDHKAAKELQKAYREFQHGNLDGAVQGAQKALQRDPNYAAAHNQLGGYYIALHQPANALREFQKTVELDPALAIGHSNLSILLMMVDRPADAETEARRAIQLDPKLTKAHYILGISLVRQKKFTSEALNHLRRAESDFPAARQISSALEQRLATASQ